MKTAIYLHFLFIAVLSSLNLFAQPDRYILNGSATRNSCNCYTLTTPATNQAGSVWNKEKINLSETFDFTFNVFLGCTDADGADGIVFIMQPISTSIGTIGEGMGFSGVQPSIGIALDTWQNVNRNDPVYDHISIQKNGIVDHGNDLAGPVAVSSTSDNIGDCQWHILRISWDPAVKSLRGYFDGKLRVEATIDLVKDIFLNDPMVYWGFSAATGGFSNLQQFCTALNPRNIASPDLSCILPNGNSFTFVDQSESFAPITRYFWDFGDGTTSNEANPSPHVYTRPGVYNVKMAITGKDGCNSDTLSKKIVVGSFPKAAFNIEDTCQGESARLTDLSFNEVGSISKRKWIIDGIQEQTTLTPVLHHLPPGNHELALQVTSEFGCESVVTSQMFTIKERPRVANKVADGCVNQQVNFEGQQAGSMAIRSWNWNFGDGRMDSVQSPQHVFVSRGTYAVTLYAMGENGCSSDTLTTNVRIDEALAFAGNDTTVLKNVPFMLSGNGNGSFSWSPFNNLNNASLAQPIATLSDDQTFLLTVTTPAGCVATDQVVITVFKGSAIYVPNAFTPNNDRLNDILKPAYAGIKTLHFFYLYNRWGEMVFKATDLSKGWDGSINGKQAPSGTYVWVIKAVDYVGQVYEMKGITTLIR